MRRKSAPFAAYDEVTADFAELLQSIPGCSTRTTRAAARSIFQARAGEECLASNVSMLLEKIRAKYLEYGIKDTPYVAVKADAGTYGMGVMMAQTPPKCANSTASSATRWRW